MASELIEIDTKDICLLCYNPSFKDDRTQPLASKRSSSLIGFKQLLRYLNVNTKELFNCSPEFLQWMEMGLEIDVEISLCAKCSLVTEEFDKLYKQHELIQLQFDKCVASLHQSMISGDASPDLVREFKTQMRPKKSMDLINASVASNLRSQTLKKCSIKLQKALPRVTVQKLNHKSQSSNNYTNEKPPHSFEKNASSSDVGKGDAPVAPSNFETPVSVDLEQLNNDFDDCIDNKPVQLKRKSAKNFSKKAKKRSASSKKPSKDDSVDKGSFSCEICRVKSFTQKSDLDRHRYMVHREYIVAKHLSSSVSLSYVKVETDITCEEICSKSLQPTGYHCFYCKQHIKCLKRNAFLLHVMRQHSNQIADEVSQRLKEPGSSQTKKCIHCSKSFASAAQLYMHKRYSHKVISCEHCPFTSHSSCHIKYHKFDCHLMEMVVPHLQPDPCPIICGQGLDAVMAQLLKGGKQCATCGTVYKKISTLRRHLLVQHFNEIIENLKVYMGQNHSQLESNPMVELENAEMSEEEIVSDDVDFEYQIKLEEEELPDISQLDPLSLD